MSRATNALRLLRRSFNATLPRQPTARLSAAPSPRLLCAKHQPPSPDENMSPKRAPQTLVDRFFKYLITPNKATGKSGFLRALGYYSAESRAIGTATTLYNQIVLRSNAAVDAELGSSSEFMPRFEMFIAHVYITLRRLRAEKGTLAEADCKIAMQVLFEVFWKDVRYRMMMKEGGLGLIASSKWIKECERIFFGIALSLDEAWGDREKMNKCIAKSFSFLKDDPRRIDKFRQYMVMEFSRLEKSTTAQIWDGIGWDANYNAATV